MDDCILYAIWLATETSAGYTGAYRYDGKLYFIDSRYDMLELYKVFIGSHYYKVSV